MGKSMEELRAEGREQGIKQGRVEGIERGIKQGRANTPSWASSDVSTTTTWANTVVIFGSVGTKNIPLGSEGSQSH